MKFIDRALLPAALLFLLPACAPPDAGVPSAPGAPASSAGSGSASAVATSAPAAAAPADEGSADGSFGKDEYIGIRADLLCAERAHPKAGPERDAAAQAVVAKYGFPRELLDSTEKDLKEEGPVYDKLLVQVQERADEVCDAAGRPKAPAETAAAPAEDAAAPPAVDGADPASEEAAPEAPE